MTNRNRNLPLTFLGTFLLMVAVVSICATCINLAFMLIQPPTPSGGWVRVFLLPVLYLAIGLAAGWGAVVIRRKIGRAEREQRRQP
jgi:hypothetical protein